MSVTYRIVYKKDRENFIKLVMKGIPALLGGKTYHLNKTINTVAKTQFGAESTKLFPAESISWKAIYESGRTLQHYILQITNQSGIYLVMRNGNNLSQYNFIIVETATANTRYAPTVRQAMELAQVISIPRDQAPLLIGRVTSKTGLEILSRKLKGV